MRRFVVWNRTANGLRAFGFDFGPFAVVVLLDALITTHPADE